RAALSEQPGGLLAALPRLDVASPRPEAAALARTPERRTGRRQPERCRLSRLGGRADRRAQPAVPAGAARCGSCAVSERILQALGRRVPRRAARQLGG